MNDELLDWDEPIDDLLDFDDDLLEDDDLLDDDDDLLDFDDSLPVMNKPIEPQKELHKQPHKDSDIPKWRKEIKQLIKKGHNYTISSETAHFTGETAEAHFEYFIGHYLRKKCKTTLFLAYHVLCKMRVGRENMTVKCNANHQECEAFISDCTPDNIVELVFLVMDTHGNLTHPNVQPNVINLPRHRKEHFILETGEPLNPESLFSMIDDLDCLLD